jgi:predicted ester cyclase
MPQPSSLPRLARETSLLRHARWRGTGTHSADWAGIPASGNRVEFHGTSTVEVERGLMRRIWIDMDMAGVMRQMARTEGSP